MCYHSSMTKITHTQAAEILGVSRQTIYNRVERGELTTPLTPVNIKAFIDTQRHELNLIERRLNQFINSTITTPTYNGAGGQNTSTDNAPTGDPTGAD